MGQPVAAAHETLEQALNRHGIDSGIDWILHVARGYDKSVKALRLIVAYSEANHEAHYDYQAICHIAKTLLRELGEA